MPNANEEQEGGLPLAPVNTNLENATFNDIGSEANDIGPEGVILAVAGVAGTLATITGAVISPFEMNAYSNADHFDEAAKASREKAKALKESCSLRPNSCNQGKIKEQEALTTIYDAGKAYWSDKREKYTSAFHDCQLVFGGAAVVAIPALGLLLHKSNRREQARARALRAGGHRV